LSRAGIGGGGTFLFVWQQNRAENESIGSAVGFDELWDALSAEGENFLALKISYRLPVDWRRGSSPLARLALSEQALHRTPGPRLRGGCTTGIDDQPEEEVVGSPGGGGDAPRHAGVTAKSIVERVLGPDRITFGTARSIGRPTWSDAAIRLRAQDKRWHLVRNASLGLETVPSKCRIKIKLSGEIVVGTVIAIRVCIQENVHCVPVARRYVSPIRNCTLDSTVAADTRTRKPNARAFAR
jgi:hypothetical protein